MASPIEEIESAALALPPEDLGTLVAHLLAHLDSGDGAPDEEVARAWREEIERRLAAADAHQTVAVPHEVVMAEVRARLEGRGSR